MKLTIEGTPDELKNVLQAICGSEEHVEIRALKTEILNLESKLLKS